MNKCQPIHCEIYLVFPEPPRASSKAGGDWLGLGDDTKDSFGLDEGGELFLSRIRQKKQEQSQANQRKNSTEGKYSAQRVFMRVNTYRYIETIYSAFFVRFAEETPSLLATQTQSTTFIYVQTIRTVSERKFKLRVRKNI